MQAPNGNDNQNDDSNPIIPDNIDWDAVMRDFSPPEWDLLLSAAAKNQLEEMRDLVERQGVPVTHSNGIAQTALHVAVLWGHLDCARYLVEKGANTNAQNTITGATPLHVALHSHKITPQQQVELVHLLVNQGNADPHIEDHFGKCPAEYIADRNHPIRLDRELMQRITPPPKGVERMRANFLKNISNDIPTCKKAG